MHYHLNGGDAPQPKYLIQFLNGEYLADGTLTCFTHLAGFADHMPYDRAKRIFDRDPAHCRLVMVLEEPDPKQPERLTVFSSHSPRTRRIADLLLSRAAARVARQYESEDLTSSPIFCGNQVAA